MEGMLQRVAATVWRRLSPDSDRERERVYFDDDVFYLFFQKQK
jgi:hypothetical protein